MLGILRFLNATVTLVLGEKNKIKKTVEVWIRKTINNERFKRDEGLIFKPIEKSNNSTPNSAGTLSKLC